MPGVIGLDIGASAVRAVEVKNSRSGGTPTRFHQVALPEGAVINGRVVQPEVVGAALAELHRDGKFSKGAGTRLAIANPDVITRTVDIADRPEKDLRKSLRWELPDYVEEATEDPLYDVHPIARWTDSSSGRDVPRMTVLLVVTPQEMVEQMTTLASNAGFRMTGVDAAPLSLIRGVLAGAASSEAATALVHVGACSSLIVVHQSGQPQYIRFLPGVGGEVVTDALMTSFTDWSREDAEGTKRALGLLGSSGTPVVTTVEQHPAAPVIAQAMSGVLAPIRESIEFANRQLPISQLMLSGGGGQMVGLADRLGAELGLQVLTAPDRAGADDGSTAGQMTLAFGAGLE